VRVRADAMDLIAPHERLSGRERSAAARSRALSHSPGRWTPMIPSSLSVTAPSNRAKASVPCYMQLQSQHPLQVHQSLVHAHAQQCPLPVRREVAQCPQEAADALL
jgi:hypothetical protein